MKCNPALLFLISIPAFLLGCASAKHKKNLTSQAYVSQLEDSMAGGHLGICIYDPTTDKYLVEYNDRKYFTPASNMKLFTCYAAMKYLGDSLVGLVYQNFSDTVINVFPTGDPTFLHPDFPKQPVFDFLKSQAKNIYIGRNAWFKPSIWGASPSVQIQPYGQGWSWEDYNDSYMVERSPFPIAGNTIKIKLKEFSYNQASNRGRHYLNLDWSVSPNFFKKFLDSFYALPLRIAVLRKMKDSLIEKEALLNFTLKRKQLNNQLELVYGDSRIKPQEIPFFTDIKQTAIEILKNDYGIQNIRLATLSDNSMYGDIPEHIRLHEIHSQPTDSLLKPMMHRSDNFFAEQTLLMISNEKLGYMSDDKIIDTLLTTDLKDIPDRPVWVDGSGLSRYNLVTPRDFVWLLNKIKTEFPFERIKNILPTGGEGTLLHYYNQDSGFIYAKTGTLGGQVAISGYLITQTGRTLTFSVLVSNHNGSASAIRRQVEEYLSAIRRKY